MIASDRHNGRSACHVDWVMNGLRWGDLFFNLADGTTYAEAMRQAELRLPGFKRGYRVEDHTFGYQIVGAADAPAHVHSYSFGDLDDETVVQEETAIDDTPVGRRRHLIALLQDGRNQEFEGEVHLSNAEADEIVALLQAGGEPIGDI